MPLLLVFILINFRNARHKQLAFFNGNLGAYMVIWSGKDKNTTQGNLAEPVGSPVAPVVFWCK